MQNFSKKFEKSVDKRRTLCYNISCVVKEIQINRYGEVSEWFMELVLKTSDLARDRGFESLLLRQFFYLICVSSALEKYPSGEGAPLLRE